MIAKCWNWTSPCTIPARNKRRTVRRGIIVQVKGYFCTGSPWVFLVKCAILKGAWLEQQIFSDGFECHFGQILFSMMNLNSHFLLWGGAGNLFTTADLGNESSLILCCIHVAARVAEALRLTWSDVDVKHRVVTRWTNKYHGGGCKPVMTFTWTMIFSRACNFRMITRNMIPGFSWTKRPWIISGTTVTALSGVSRSVGIIRLIIMSSAGYS